MTYGIASLEIFLSALDDHGFPRFGGITCTYAVGILEKSLGLFHTDLQSSGMANKL